MGAVLQHRLASIDWPASDSEEDEDQEKFLK